jgi:transcription antitermination factor NusG
LALIQQSLWKTPQRQKDSEALPENAAALLENSPPPLVGEWTTNHASWFAVYTNSRHEKCVSKQFWERNIENFLPLYLRTHCWSKRSNVQLELPLFPNYVFIRIHPRQRIAVLGVPGVLGIVGGRIPSTLPDAEIEALRAGLMVHRFEPHACPAAGERVRIKAGAMAGMEGILLRQKNKLRLVLTISLIQRSVIAEVDTQDVEPVFRSKF